MCVMSLSCGGAKVGMSMTVIRDRDGNLNRDATTYIERRLEIRRRRSGGGVDS